MPCHHFPLSLFSLTFRSDVAVRLYFKWVLSCHSSSDINRKITFMKSEGLDLVKERLWDLFHCFRPANWVQLSSGRDRAKDSHGWWCLSGRRDIGGGCLAGSCWGSRAAGAGRVCVCVPRWWGGGWDFPGMPFLCAALQVHPCSSKGQLQMLLSRSKSRKATWNLPGKRE